MTQQYTQFCQRRWAELQMLDPLFCQDTRKVSELLAQEWKKIMADKQRAREVKQEQKQETSYYQPSVHDQSEDDANQKQPSNVKV